MAYRLFDVLGVLHDSFIHNWDVFKPDLLVSRITRTLLGVCPVGIGRMGNSLAVPALLASYSALLKYIAIYILLADILFLSLVYKIIASSERTVFPNVELTPFDCQGGGAIPKWPRHELNPFIPGHLNGLN